MWKLSLVLLATAIPNAARAADCLTTPPTFQFAITADGVTWNVTDAKGKPVGTLVLSCKADPNDINSWAAMASAIPQQGNKICEGANLESPRPDLNKCKVVKASAAPK